MPSGGSGQGGAGPAASCLPAAAHPPGSLLRHRVNPRLGEIRAAPGHYTRPHVPRPPRRPAPADGEGAAGQGNPTGGSSGSPGRAPLPPSVFPAGGGGWRRASGAEGINRRPEGSGGCVGRRLRATARPRPRPRPRTARRGSGPGPRRGGASSPHPAPTAKARWRVKAAGGRTHLLPLPSSLPASAGAAAAPQGDGRPLGWAAGLGEGGGSTSVSSPLGAFNPFLSRPAGGPGGSHPRHGYRGDRGGERTSGQRREAAGRFSGKGAGGAGAAFAQGPRRPRNFPGAVWR